MHQAQGYVTKDYLQAAARLFAPIKQRGYEKLRIEEGQRLLDVGCGPGIDVMAMAERVGEGGEVVGVDHDRDMLEEARKRAAAVGLGKRIRFEAADAVALPFADAHFDGCRSERLFMHLAHAGRAFEEMVRVIKPGGRIIATETDWASLSCDSDHVDIERRLVRFRAEKSLNNGYSARRLFRQFKAPALNEIELEIFPLHTADMELFRSLTLLEEVERKALEAGAVASAELESWRAELKARKAEETFFGSVNVILASGRKP